MQCVWLILWKQDVLGVSDVGKSGHLPRNQLVYSNRTVKYWNSAHSMKQV